MNEPGGLTVMDRVLIGLYVAVIALLPFGRLAEVPVLMLACWGLLVAWQGGSGLWRQAQVRLFTQVFAGMLLITVVASLDSLWPEKSWLITLGQWRFYLAGLVLLVHPRRIQLLRHIMAITVGLLLLWCLDASVQALVGHNLLGMPSYPGRLTGIFAHNVKLGPVLALLLPLLLVWVRPKNSWWRWLLVSWLLVIVLLSGTRSAWLMAGFVMVIHWWQHVKGRRLLMLLKATALTAISGTLLWFFSADFQDRITRSMQIFSADQQAIDFALADRLPIWQTAINMYLEHPVNGVGPRAFRVAYADHAADDDVWLAEQGAALHAHHWVLEIMAETGTIGMALMTALVVLVVARCRRQFRDPLVWPLGVGLMAALLPVVSLYSLFSSFWSMCLWWVFMMMCAGIKND